MPCLDPKIEIDALEAIFSGSSSPTWHESSEVKPQNEFLVYSVYFYFVSLLDLRHFVFMYTYIYVCICIYVYTCYIYIHDIYLYMYISIIFSVHIYTYICIHTLPIFVYREREREYWDVLGIGTSFLKVKQASHQIAARVRDVSMQLNAQCPFATFQDHVFARNEHCRRGLSLT